MPKMNLDFFSSFKINNNAIIECVVNVSHGQKASIIEQIADSIEKIPGQKLLDIDSSASANRTVYTFAGHPNAVFNAAFELFKSSISLIDMTEQIGTHPRIGAIDVCPFVALKNISQQDLIQPTAAFAKKIGEELNIPVYLYEHSSLATHRKSLPSIRSGSYEGLLKKMQKEGWKPDFGPTYKKKNIPSILKTGASVIGVRDILVAFNISLKTTSLEIAQKIAYRIRSIGWPKKFQNESEKTINYKFPTLRSIGWYSEDYGSAQVSCNFLNYQITSPLSVWEKVKELAIEYGTEAIGCEVIGLIPEECILQAGQFAADKNNIKISPEDIPGLIAHGIHHLGLNKVRPFDPDHKILDYRIATL